MNLNDRQLILLNLFRSKESLSSQEALYLLTSVPEKTSLITVKRDLSYLRKLSFIASAGKGRSVRYKLTSIGKLLSPIESKAYCAIDQDYRPAKKAFNFNLFEQISEIESFFAKDESEKLSNATICFQDKTKRGSLSLHKKELERFIIELAWKSSKIEGNTYSILDTERLIRDGIEAEGKTAQEAKMILNHKSAFLFVLENKDFFRSKITLSLLEELHAILVKGLNIESGLRRFPVGITGTNYLPLDNYFQIKEATINFIKLLNDRNSMYEKSLLAQALLPYIQPFDDGNKRTSRLLANAVLVANGAAPLSYRNVDEINYKEAVLVFYEQSNIVPLKQIFIDQYVFAANNYNLSFV
jgi:Fic/DOC family